MPPALFLRIRDEGRSAVAPSAKHETEVRTVGQPVAIDVSAVRTPGPEEESEIGAVDDAVSIEVFRTRVTERGAGDHQVGLRGVDLGGVDVLGAIGDLHVALVLGLEEVRDGGRGRNLRGVAADGHEARVVGPPQARGLLEVVGDVRPGRDLYRQPALACLLFAVRQRHLNPRGLRQ